MTFAAADVRLGHIPMGLFTVGRDLHPPLQQGRQRAVDRAAQAHELAGIGHLDGRHGAGLAQVGRPLLIGGFEQAALFHIAATVIVPEEIRAFFASRSAHGVSFGKGDSHHVG